MSGCLVAFACGVILLYTFPVVPPLGWLMGAVVSALFGVVRFRSRPLGAMAAVLLGLAAGVAWATWHTSDRLQQALPGGLEGRVLPVSGYLCGIPSRGSFDSLRFNFCVTRWHLPDAPEMVAPGLPDKIRLAWYGADGRELPGHRLRLEVVLKKPHGALNPAGFRYETWLFRQGFGATGTVRAVAEDWSEACPLHCRYVAWRHQLADAVALVMGQGKHYPLLASLLIGHRGEMTPEHWEILQGTGTIHLVAISGLHLGLVAIGAGFIARRLINAVPAGYLAPATGRYLALAIVAIASLVYALAAGFTVPTRRALIMVLVAGWVVLKGRQVPAWQGLALALFLVLLMDPFAPLDQGFWLSFGAVAVLVTVFAGRLAPPRWWSALLLAQVAVFAGLWPILSVLGQGQPYSGLLANLLAIPWVSVVVMPVLAIGSALIWLVPASQSGVLMLFDGVLEVLWQVLGWLASLEMPAGHPGIGPATVFSLLILTALVLPSGRVRWVLGLSGLVILADTPIRGNDPNPWVESVEIRVWDVGQGLSVLARHHDQVVLYDTGPAVPGVFSAVDSVLIPNLQRLGVKRIDTLIISHGDGDHAGGLTALFAAFPVGEVISGEPVRLRQLTDGVAAPAPVPCATARSRGVGGMTVDFWQSPEPANANDASCVVTISRSEGSAQVILPGDITRTAEHNLLTQQEAEASVIAEAGERVVVAPHHGSNTSSSAAWVTALAPQWVIYSAGYRHRFGHPHPAVVDRYRAAGSRQLNTAESGAIRLELGATGVTVHQQREGAPFWIRSPVTDW
ncbi:MAG: DNA internalization-related competence protein ComEC/Rec2 [Pseudomonadota bacterium]